MPHSLWLTRRYSEEEVRALQQPLEDAQQAGAAPAAAEAPAAAAAAAPAPVDPAALKRQLMGMIPKDKEGVFAFAVDWPVLEGAPADVHDKISGAVVGWG